MQYHRNWHHSLSVMNHCIWVIFFNWIVPLSMAISHITSHGYLMTNRYRPTWMALQFWCKANAAARLILIRYRACMPAIIHASERIGLAVLATLHNSQSLVCFSFVHLFFFHFFFTLYFFLIWFLHHINGHLCSNYYCLCSRNLFRYYYFYYYCWT